MRKKGDFETFPEIRGEILGNAFFSLTFMQEISF